MWFRTIDGRWYIHQMRGAVFVSWVSEKDKGMAEFFPIDKADEWLSLMTMIAGVDLVAVKPFV